MKKTTNHPSPKLQASVSLLSGQPPQVQEPFQFLLATAMHEAGKFGLVSVAEVEGRWRYTFSGAGEVFSVVQPEIDKDTEREVVRGMVREILGEEGLL